MIKIFEKNDLYSFENQIIRLTLQAVGGRIFTKSLLNKLSGYEWKNNEDSLPTVYIPGFDYSKS